ncbi:hypothetical protein MSG28_016046 [Choristoneura fumiferana]|uniref:Uncharacterized protein n=1 Tax=Choristoneura fumiferana TaxID=7141 RepID=A0ACC0K6A8_CHOFU|nr:hypothetical protein MSG28_016046 [Choristoneura fumiferana]
MQEVVLDKGDAQDTQTRAPEPRRRRRLAAAHAIVRQIRVRLLQRDVQPPREVMGPQRYEQLARHRAACGASPHSAAPHACAQCGKRFTHQHSLTRHAHNHARQLYRCVVCKASFATASQLATHLNSHLANYKRLKP